MYDRRMAPGSCVGMHGTGQETMHRGLPLARNSALTIRLWSGKSSDIAPFDSFLRFHQMWPHSIQICGWRMRLRPTTFRPFFSHCMHARPTLAEYGIAQSTVRRYRYRLAMRTRLFLFFVGICYGFLHSESRLGLVQP